MLFWSIGFFIVATIAAVLGFGEMAGSASGIAQITFVLFFMFAILSFLTAGRQIDVRSTRAVVSINEFCRVLFQGADKQEFRQRFPLR